MIEYGGDFNKFVTTKKLQRQEGVVFRHLLRLILLLGEFQQLCPEDVEDEDWNQELVEISSLLTDSCNRVDSTSTEKTLQQIEIQAAELKQNEANL